MAQTVVDKRALERRPLRHSRRVEHLDDINDPIRRRETAQLFDHIYEAQVSVMVTGLDHWFWTAYCFADVYFKGQEHNERVQQYHINHRDPHSGGKFDLHPPIWDPREYFLRTLVSRMEQVKQEWNNAVFMLLQ
jgi:hypothetical protein